MCLHVNVPPASRCVTAVYYITLERRDGDINTDKQLFHKTFKAFFLIFKPLINPNHKSHHDMLYGICLGITFSQIKVLLLSTNCPDNTYRVKSVKNSLCQIDQYFSTCWFLIINYYTRSIVDPDEAAVNKTEVVTKYRRYRPMLFYQGRY